MVLFLEIMNGPQQGRKFRVSPGLTVGRRDGDIRLEEDGKVSGFHAKVELDNKGKPVLHDQGSANGLVINGRKLKKVALIPGVTFRVGDTLFIATELSFAEAEALAPAKTWEDHLEDSLRHVPAQNRKIEGSAQTFTPILELEFIQGPQADERMVLSYGPRVAGLDHLDVELKDPMAPERAFEIHPGPGSALLVDQSGGKVLVNGGKPAENHVLNEGDEIGVAMTLIRVRYL